MTIAPPMREVQRLRALLADKNAEIERLRALVAHDALLRELEARYISPTSEWGKGYNAGISNAIDALLAPGASQPSEADPSPNV